MTEILKAVSVALFAIACGVLGRAFSRLKSRAWLLGYVAPLAVVAAITTARMLPRVAVLPAFSWLLKGRLEFVLLGAMGAMLLNAPLSRIKSKRLRPLITVFLGILVVHVSMRPFIEPLLIRDTLAGLTTQIDADGVCRQTTHFTCGPAAMVTALRHLGVEAEEGELAILSYTTSAAGASSDLLADAVRSRYADQGVAVGYRVFESLDDLRDAGLVVVIIKLRFLIDHYVVVTGVDDDQIHIDDPVAGRRTLPYADFRKKWRFTGLVVTRSPRAK